MDDTTDVWPNGGIEFGVGHADGDDVVVVTLPDDDGASYRLFLRKAVFVTIADHFKMLADEIAAGRIQFPRR